MSDNYANLRRILDMALQQASDGKGSGDTDRDQVNPEHYQGIADCSNCGHPIEAISITEGFGFRLGNSLKYILRAGKKGDRLTDLRKARWYIDREISSLEQEGKHT